jgi:asparagine synthase (glutamine-hydrolysing)
MLEAFERWGIEAAVSRLNGQFAFAVWDGQTRALTLVRDRLGIKPLYYGWVGGTFVFASELDAIRLHPKFRADVNPEAVVALIELGYIPAPLSIYNGVFKLPPGAILTLRNPGDDHPPHYYWDLQDIAGSETDRVSDPKEALAELESLVRDSVKLRMIADVPLGAFLSGGIDSSVVCAVMQAVASGPVKTFSIGFEETGFDEAPFASTIADHLGTSHTELYVTAKEAMDVIPNIPGLYDEPFADSSQIPTHLVSKLARREVTVSLSGDGGDELFAGYDRYRRVLSQWPRFSGVPRSLRSIAARASSLATNVERGSLAKDMLSRAPKVVQKRVGFGQYGRAIGMLGSMNIAEFYRRSLSLTAAGFLGPRLDGVATNGPVLNPAIPAGLGTLETMTYVDMRAYLPDDILVKVDRASMAVSLEARVPLLDHRIVEFSWRVPFPTAKWLAAPPFWTREVLKAPWLSIWRK